MILRLALLGVCLSMTAMAQSYGKFEATEVPGEYRFDTGVLRGTIFGTGVSLQTSAGMEISKPPGIFSFYRVFTTNKRWGDSMRIVPCETSLLAPDILRIHWPAAEERPFAIAAIYQWSGPETLDLQIQVKAEAELPDFEVFLSSYFTEAFPAPEVCSLRDESEHVFDSEQPFVTADKTDGVWQMFPRDKAAVDLIKDGRWDIPPNPVDWAIRREFTLPISLRRAADGLTCVITTRPQDCFALSMPHAGEQHYSLYQSFFGRTLAAGDTVDAYIRLDVDEFTDDMALYCYRLFLERTALLGPTPEPWMPNGYNIVLQHKDRDVTEAISALRSELIAGTPRLYAKRANPDEGVFVLAHGDAVIYKITGLQSESDYVLAFDWWDPDQQGRIQRVRFAIGDEWTEVLPPVPALAFHEDKPTFARVLLPIPKAACEAGFMRVAFEKVEGPDALLSEFWLLQREDAPPRKRVLIVTGDDYPGHLWRETSVELAEILREDPRLEVSINECPAILGSPLLSHYDAVVLHFKNYNDRLPLGEAVWSGLEQYVKDGGGLVLVHFGCGAFQEWPGFVEIAGRVWDPALRGHDPYGLFEVKIADETHAITGGMEAFQTEDELYTCLTGHTPIQVLCEATSKVDSKPYPMAFTVGETGGRVFHCTLGHDVNAFQAEGTRALYRRATAWAAGLEP